MVGFRYGGDGKSGSCRGISGMVGSTILLEDIST